MSDIKRVVLTTLESQKGSDNTAKKYSRTVRIKVSLSESNEDKCPEFSYKDELAAVKKKTKVNEKEVPNVSNGLDQFDEDNDDDVRRIALEMEAKYGSGVTGGAKKKRKGRKDDYADIGAGYDESDSFIDNTDGYDEIIPHNVTTVRGGFYINSGALEFKTDDEATSDISSSSSEGESDEGNEEKEVIKTKRKRILDSSNDEGENSNHSTQSEQKQNGDKPNISMHQAIKKKLFSREKIQIKKQKLAQEERNTVKELLREKRPDPTSTDLLKDVLKENKKPMRLSSVDAAIESVIGRKSQDKAEVKVDEIKNSTSVVINDPDVSLVLTGIEAVPNHISTPEIVKLPENLPADIVDIISRLKQAAKDYKDGGKVKFFSGEVNVLLLSLERKCKVLGRSSRVKVYEHLAPFVRCRKETLVKRAKNLVYEEDCKKLEKTVYNLNSQIIQLIPALITNYEKESQRILQKKFSQEAANNEELKHLKAPRRRFPLHEELKRMIRDIVNLKKRCLLHEGKPKNNLEELLTNYLKKDILILWPEGWMSMTVLKKYCTTVAIKTPDPKALTSTNDISTKHSQKLPVSSNAYRSGNNLTIMPVNLSDKFGEVSTSNVNSLSSRTDTIIRPIISEKSHDTTMQFKTKPTERPPEKSIKSVPKEKSIACSPETKDNGIIVLGSDIKHESVITKETHCPIIDLTDPPVRKSPVEEVARSLILSRDTILNHDFGTSLKSKFPALSVTPTNTVMQSDRDDVQNVLESLKTLQKMSSPSKSEMSNVSVIAFNKNYSNSNSNHSSGTNNDRTSLSGAIGFNDEFQKQFISPLTNHNPSQSTPSSKPGYNKCS